MDSQDDQDDHDHETTLEDLPDELLIPIFDHLPSDFLPIVSCVSEQWKNVVNEEIGSEITVSDLGEIRGFTAPEKIGDSIVKVCHVRMVTGRIPKLKKPDKLKILYFKAPVTSHVFNTLTSETLNLTKVYFLHSSLTSDIKSKNSGELNLPSLKLLHLCDRSLESGDATHPGFIPKNINFMLQQTFPSLRELVVSTVADHTSTESMGKNLIYFVQKHYKTIQTLKFNVATTILGIPALPPNIQLQNQYESVELSSKEKDGLDWAKLKQVSFKTLELDLGKNFVVGLDEWFQILDSQNSLQSMYLFKDAPVPLRLILNPVLQSSHNLVYLQLGVETVDEDSNVTPIDCGLFEVCKGLRKFGLCGNGSPDRPLQKELINCRKLPKRILALMLKNILVESNDLEDMIFWFNHVIKLTLDGVGSKEEFGVTFKLLDKLLTTRKCKEIIVKSFNNANAEQYPDLVNEFEKESFTIPSLATCHFHGKFNEELNQYIFICV